MENIIPLSDLKNHATGYVSHLVKGNSSENISLLKSRGFVPGRRVELMHKIGNKYITKVGNDTDNFAINYEMAKSVMVKIIQNDTVEISTKNKNLLSRIIEFIKKINPHNG